jgi:HK97 family phage prohead protease
MERSMDRVVRGWLQAEGVVQARDADGVAASVLRVSGYATVFDSDSEDFGGGWREQIAPGAFRDVLGEKPDVRFLANHEGLALARTENNTLRLWEDDRGLRFEADLNPHAQAARDLHALIERGDVTQMSFGFRIGEQATDEDARMWTVTRVSHLYEVSAVAFPAYSEASVEAGSVDERSVSLDAADAGFDGWRYRV